MRGAPDTSEPQLLESRPIAGNDFAAAGAVSIAMKNILKQLGVAPAVVRRAAIVGFEAEMNVVMYGGGGEMRLYASPALVRLEISDRGPGIADLELAMTEGWSTATAEMREMGFGAGMGLPNIRRNSDRLHIDTAPGRGTCLRAEMDVPPA